MNQIIYNSFPRSGNVYSSHVSPRFFRSSLTAVHIPQIFGIKDLDQITVFRKPEDAISSLVNRQFRSPVKVEKEKIMISCINACELYRQFMYSARDNKDLIYIGKFQDLTTNTVEHFENIAKRFNRKLNPNYELHFKNLEFLGNVWDDMHSGHIPRNKDEVRLDIEKKVGSLDIIKELNKEYEEFINVFATKIK
jgi:hypothetical protein